jgi:hypothetical protein
MELDDGDVTTLIAEIGRLREKVKTLRRIIARLQKIRSEQRQQINYLQQQNKKNKEQKQWNH